ncbi:YceI family protein [Aureitalea sp. L0-47]|uniref:YceI family protein n=1 Tax=Aureitalea sp. L0-47 TaxID=2816962 RepID=UPI002238D345|nr:YceI family protein [Aureitalea sp. L0-47]MCW5520729.1 YceI family protein [Aureitalea sp. L0-47]
MKKVVNSALILVIALGAMAFTTPVKKKVNVSKSTINWKGEKVLGTHHGTLKFKEGWIEMDDNGISGGKFVVDMTSLVVTDLEGGSKGKLEGHLKSDDFFGVNDHPTATLMITSASKIDSGYKVKGDITIKGTTEPVSFMLMDNGDNTHSAKLVIDRTKFGIRYGSGSFFDDLGDKTINDEFELEAKIVL